MGVILSQWLNFSERNNKWQSKREGRGSTLVIKKIKIKKS